MQLLVMSHSRSGRTQHLTDLIVQGATDEQIEGVEVVVRSPFDIDAETVRACDALIVATPEHFGAMAGAIKDCFERIYYDLIDDERGLPYALVVKGEHDGQGTVRGVEAICTGLGWRQAVPSVVVLGDPTADDERAVVELGATVAAGVQLGIF